MKKQMTEKQFVALADLLRLRSGDALVAARLVLVEGFAPSVAAREVGVTKQIVNNAVRRCERGLGLAFVAVGLS